MNRISLLSSVCFACMIVNSVYATPDVNNGLIGYWPLNGNALDYSGYGNDGEMLTGASFVLDADSDREVLQTVWAAAYNQGHVKVALPSSYSAAQNELNFTTSGSVWVLFEDETEHYKVESNLDGYWQGFIRQPPGLYYVARRTNTDALRAMTRRDDNGTPRNWWPESAQNDISSEGIWYHVAWTFHSNDNDIGFLRFYINGVLTREYVRTLYASYTSDFRIGASWERSSNNAKFAEMRLYDRILTDEEIAILANPNIMNGSNVSIVWDEANFPDSDAPFAIDPSVLGVDLVDQYGNSLLTYESADRIPEVTYQVISGPAIHDEDGNIQFIGGGYVVIRMSSPGNEYYAAVTEDVTITVPGASFNTALWKDDTQTGFFVTSDSQLGGSVFGQEAFRITSSGKFGIGVHNPVESLEVAGNAVVSGGQSFANGVLVVTPEGNLIINQGTANEIRLGADGTVVIPPQGDIGMFGE